MSVSAAPLYAAARPILLAGDARLRQHSTPVDALDATTDEAVAALGATLHAFQRQHGFGRALAAAQIGIARRLIVMDLGAGPIVLFNPEITWRSAERVVLWDDCFSLPDCLVRVTRHASISLRYRDAQFRPRHWTQLPGDLAELLQHEIDHLDGRLMTDDAVGDDAVQPISARAALIGPQRPTHRLSLQRMRAAASQIDRVFTQSAQFVSTPLSTLLGCTLTLKDETNNPIGCFKGRGADTYVTQRVQGGDRRPLVCASAGNFGQALAYAARRHGVAVVVFAATTANALKLQRMRALGADVRLHGDDFDSAKQAARDYAAATASVWVEDGQDIAIAEGAASIAQELLADGGIVDTVVLPLGNGALLTGVARWIKAASPMTRVIGVCSRGASAMADSWRNGVGGALVEHARVDTIADGIAVRRPIAAAVADMHGLVDEVVLVSDDHLIQAMRQLHAAHGSAIEPAGVAGLAAVFADPGAYVGQAVATVLCGANLTPAQQQAWLSRADDTLASISPTPC